MTLTVSIVTSIVTFAIRITVRKSRWFDHADGGGATASIPYDHTQTGLAWQ